jgi:hypothetical protein
MRVAQSLSADENAPEWAFSKRKGLKPPILVRFLTAHLSKVVSGLKNGNVYNLVNCVNNNLKI